MKYTTNLSNLCYCHQADATTHLFSRGFTGHEHLDKFGLINMNGRLYDPLLGRFLSPDPFIQAPDNTQSYNRYSYCLNNPLIFSDPSGYVTSHSSNNSNSIGMPNSQYHSLYSGEYNYYAQRTCDFHSDWESSWMENINNGSINTGEIYNLGGSGWNISGSGNGIWNKQYIDLGVYGKIPYYTNSYSGAIRTGYTYSYTYKASTTYEMNGETKIYSGVGFGIGYKWLTILPHYSKRIIEQSGGKLQSIPNEIANGIGLESTLVGGSASSAAADLKYAGEAVSSYKYLKVGGNIVSGFGLGVTYYNFNVKYQNGTENTADWVDLGANSTLFTLGLFITNPVGVGILVGAGIGYGIYRISGGDNADKWINDKFGYK